ncbi:MAG: septum formation protein Maf [Rhodospirillaceae bacterium]|nr:septum formation protein Maf [Rhodospirillaceae bacterium]
MSNLFYNKVNSKLILASQSSQRLSLLNSIGIIPFKVVNPGIDETILKYEKPKQYVLRVASFKAKKILAEYPDNVVLSADTIVVKGTRIIDKTENKNEAYKSLLLLSGGWHRVYSSVVVVKKNKVYNKLVMTRVKFKRLSQSDLNLYLNSNEWSGKSGSYAIQGAAAGFIIEIKGSYSNVVGLPLYETISLIRGVGV